MPKMVNHKTVEFTGYSEQELLSMSISAFIHPDDRAMVVERYQERMKGEELPSHYAFRLSSKDGSTRWVEISVVKIDWNGRSATLNFLTDITDRKRTEDALLFTRHSIDSATETLVTIAKDGHFVDVNDAFCRTSGYSRDELLKMTVKDIDPDYNEKIWPVFWNKLKLSGSLTIETTHHTKEGKTYPVETTLTYFEYNGNEYHCGFARDISERKKAEEEVQKSEERYRNVIEDQTEFICRFLPDGTHLFVNDAYCRYFGKNRDDLIGHRFRPKIPPEDRERVARLIASLTPEHPVEAIDQRIIMPDGSIRWQRWSDRAIYHADGSLKEYQSVGRDITDRKHEEEVLQESERKFRALSENSQDYIMRYDREHRHTYANPACLRVVGITAEQLIGKTHHEMGFPPDLCALWEPAIDKVFATGQPFGETFAWTGADGEVVLDWQLYPEKDEKGEVVSVLGVSRDITEHQRMEDALAKSQIQLAEAMNLAHLVNWEFDVASGIFTFNDRFYSLYDTTAEREDGYQMPVEVYAREFVHPDEVGMVAEEVQKAITATDPNYTSQIEHRIIRRDGEIRHIIVRLGITKDAEGRTVKTHGANQDITERKRMEDTLRESEEVFREIFNNASEAMFLHKILPSGLPGHYFRVNDIACKRLGYSREELYNMSPLDMVDPQHLPNIPDIAAKVKSNGSATFEAIHQRKDGSTFPVEVSTHRFLLQGEQVGLSIARDITDRKRAEEALRESEERYSSLFTNNYSISLLIDPDTGVIVDANAAACKYYGYSLEQITEIGIYEINRIDKQRVIRNLNVAKKKGARHFFSIHFLADGRKRNVEIYSGPILVNGKLLFYSIIHDITERIQAEEALKESKRELADIISFLPDATLVIDKNGTVRAWNRAMVEMTGVPAEQMIGKANYEYALPFYHERRPMTIDLVLHDDPAIAAKYPVMKKEGRSIRSEIFIPHFNNGRGAYLWFTASPLYDTDSNISGVIESIRDITDRKQVEEALQKNRETYRELVESISDIIFEIDREGKITYISPVVHKVLEFEPEEMIGKNFIEFVYPEDRNLLIRKFSELLEGMEHPSDYRVTTKSGGVRWVRTQTKPVMMEKSFCGARGTLIDITERKRAEEAIRQANKKLNLLSSITRHDINNQLTVQMGYLALLEQKQLDPTTFNNYFGKVTTAAQRISAMIQFTKEYENIGVNAPVWQGCRTLVDTAAKQAPLGQVMVKNDLPPETEVFADSLIVKVFYNLMDNAARYGGKITTIRFSAEERDGDHLIICEDDGDGVIAEEKEKIFERGFGKNTGMGLFLAQEILSITGITIRETGEPGKGAQFEITVPKGVWRMHS